MPRRQGSLCIEAGPINWVLPGAPVWHRSRQEKCVVSVVLLLIGAVTQYLLDQVKMPMGEWFVDGSIVMKSGVVLDGR